MVYCGRFGCGCCTCLECYHWKEDCVCKLRKKAEAFREKHKDTEDPAILEALDILEEVK